MYPTYAERLTLPIRPGIGAGGFAIGQSITAFLTEIGPVLLADMLPWQSGGPSSNDLRQQAARKGAWGWGWNRVRDGIRSVGSITAVDDAIDFRFNAAGQLCWIFLREGYTGAAPGGLRVGSMGAEAKALSHWEWDEGDELFYAEDPPLNGVAIATGPETLDDDDRIELISVQNFPTVAAGPGW